MYLVVIGLFIVFLVYDTADDRVRLNSAFGIVVFLCIGFVFSAAPRKVVWRHVVWGIGLQFAFGLIILRWDFGRRLFDCLGTKIATFMTFADEGSGFVFEELITEMAVVGFQVLSIVIFFGFFIQILYYLGAMQWVVMKLGWLLQTTIGTTACESVSAAANIFLGLAIAPLLIKPYLEKMTKSELHAVMTGGFATIAGPVLGAYISFGISASHLMTASVMSAPAALALSKLFYPEVEISRTKAKDIKIIKTHEVNLLHAGIEGVRSTISLIASIIANVIAFMAFVKFTDSIFNWACVLVDIDDGKCSLSNVLGYLFMPFAYAMGVPWEDCYAIGQLLGIKTVVNNFVAYLQFGQLITENKIGKRAEVIATYALCGFGDFAGVGIQIGAVGGMAPSRKDELAQLGMRAMIAGNFASFLTACVAGTLFSTESFEIDVSSNSTIS